MYLYFLKQRLITVLKVSYHKTTTTGCFTAANICVYYTYTSVIKIFFLSINGSNLGRKSPSKTNDRKRLEDLVFPIDLKKKTAFSTLEIFKSFHICQIIKRAI